MRHTDLTDKEVAGIIDHADAGIPAAKLRHPFSFQETPFTPIGAPTEDYHVGNKRDTDRGALDATPTYVGVAPTWKRINVADTWIEWDLSLLVPGPARFVEILHRNPWTPAAHFMGSRKPGSGIHRTLYVHRQDEFTWTTELSPSRTIEIFADFTLIFFYLVGYWT